MYMAVIITNDNIKFRFSADVQPSNGLVGYTSELDSSVILSAVNNEWTNVGKCVITLLQHTY